MPTAKDDIIYLRVKNWNNLQGRTDVKNPKWFKFYHDFFHQPEYFSMSHRTVILWFYLLAMCSHQNRAEVALSSRSLRNVLSTNVEGVRVSLLQLNNFGWIENLRGHIVSASCPQSGTPDKEQDKDKDKKTRKKVCKGNQVKNPTSPPSPSHPSDERLINNDSNNQKTSDTWTHASDWARDIMENLSH